MNKESHTVTQYHVRHGKSIHNGGDIFYGGSPDRPGALVSLAEIGQQQARVAAWMARNLDLSIAGVYHSTYERARHTADLFTGTYGPTLRITELAGLHEIDHGGLQEAGMLKGQAAPYRDGTVVAMAKALQRFEGMNTELLAKYAGWVAPNGWGDGESYLAAGIRAYAATDAFLDHEGVAFFAHNGSLRQNRALTASLSLAQRLELAEQHRSISEMVIQTGEDIASFRQECSDRPYVAELSGLLMPLAEVSAPLVLQLGKLSLPAIDDVIGDRSVLGNATIAQVGYQEDGRMVRGNLWVPNVLDETVGLQSGTVTVVSGSDWV